MNLDETAHMSDLIHTVCNIGHKNALSSEHVKYIFLKSAVFIILKFTTE